MTEYGAVILLVAAVAGVVLVGGVPDRVSALIGDAVCAVPGDADCAEPEDPGIGVDPDTGAALDPAEEGGLTTMAGIIAEPEDDNSEERQDWDRLPDLQLQGCDPLCTPSGPMPHDNGAPLPYRDYPEEAQVARSQDSYNASDLGDVSGCNEWTLCTEHDIETARDDVGEWLDESTPLLPNAEDALRHWLEGSGDTMEVDVAQLMRDVPEFQEAVTAQQHDIGRRAIEQAKQIPPDELNGPITFPVKSQWESFGLSEDNSEFTYADSNWQQTMGDWNYYTHGKVTVEPPKDPGGEWTYKVQTGTNVATYYSFQSDMDGDADIQWATSAGPLGVGTEFDRSELHDMHRTGLARDFALIGAMDSSSTAEVTGP
jgi:hypothetical protein